MRMSSKVVGGATLLLALASCVADEDKTLDSTGDAAAEARVTCPPGTHRAGNKCVADSDTTAPSTPTGLTATATSSSQISLAWTASTDDVGVSGYKIFRGGVQIATTGATSYQNQGLTPDTTYSYSVAAYDSAGNTSALSATASATTPGATSTTYDAAYVTTPLTIDGGLADWGSIPGVTLADASGRTPSSLDNQAVVRLAWDATYLYAAYTVTDTELQAAVTTADSGALYKDDAIELYIDTLNNDGAQMQVDDYQFLVSVAGQLTDERGTGSGKDLSWDGAGSRQAVVRTGTLNGGTLGTDSGYVIELAIRWADLGVSSPAGKTVGIELAVDDRDDNGATNQSFDWAGLSLYGNPAAWRDVRLVGGPSDASAPSTPSGLAAASLSASQINLTWLAAADDVGVSDYKIYRGTGTATPTYLTTVAGTATSFQNTGLAASTSYTYKVQALDAAGHASALSAGATATTQAPPADTTAPSTPTGLSASVVSSSQINLSWAAASDNVGVTGYKIYRGTGSTTPAFLTSVSGTSFQNTGLSASTSYTYKVQAVDAAGNASAQSAGVTKTTFGAAVVGSLPGPGPFNMFASAGGEPQAPSLKFCAMWADMSSTQFVTAINNVRSHGMRVMLLMFAGNRANVVNGKFDYATWKTNFASYNTQANKDAVAAGVADGIILGASLMDEPQQKDWGGVVTKAMMDDMATIAKGYFPTLPIGFNMAFDYRASERFHVVDYINAQTWLPGRYGATPEEMRDRALAQAALDGVVMVFSLNIYVDPENQTSGVLAPDNDRYRMTAANVLQWGTVLGRAGAGLTMWRYHPDIFSLQAYKDAFASLQADLSSRPGRSWKRP
jgi:chitodextrinase